MEGIKICEYGCGREAKYQFKNGKWCCSKIVQSCSGHIKKRVGQKRSMESRKRMSDSQKGHTPWNKGKKTGQNTWLGKHHNNKTKKKIGLANKISIEKIKEKYPIFSKIEEMRYNPDKPGEKEIQVHCKNINCINSKEKGGWFTPTYTQRYERIRHLEDKNGNKKGNLYCSKICKEKYIKYYQQLSIDNIKEKYPTFSKIEKMRYNPNKPGEKEIQIHCKNHKCSNSKEKGGWFTPISGQISERIRQVENGHGGSYLYCSYKCKEECPLYGKTVNQLIKQDQISSGYLDEPWYNSKEYKIWRDRVFELDKYKCVYCENPAKHVHHILPQKSHPELSLDPENGLSCCKKCHFKYGHKGDCSTGKLSKLICEKIFRIKRKEDYG